MHRALQEIRVESGDTIIVGLSGGVDSLALAILSSQVASTLNLRVVAGHYDHGSKNHTDGTRMSITSGYHTVDEHAGIWDFFFFYFLW